MWVTKYRDKVLTIEVSERVRDLVRRIYETFAIEIEIEKGVVSKDYVHILVRAPPTMAHSEIMSRFIVHRSSRLLEEFPDLRKGYWGRG